MARKVKFPLKMADGEEVRTLDALKEHFDVESVVGYFSDGRLLSWLNARYYEDEAEKVRQLTKGDSELPKKLCEIFGVDSDDEVDAEEIAWRQERLNRLKQYTDDREIWERVDQVAFDQEDLGDLLDDEDVTLIYLCHNRFTIPLRVTDRTYVGIGKAVAVIRSNKVVDFDELNIEFKKISFDDDYEAVLKKSGRRKKSFDDYDDYNDDASAKPADDPKKLYDEGKAAYNNSDFKTALEKYKQAAELGYIDAFSSIGLIYEAGEGDIEQDIDEARRWYKLGMEKGEGDSFGNYAISLIRGTAPTDSEKREAFKCLKRATELSNAGVFWLYLGDMYRNGTGTRKDIYEAIRCYEKAVDAGDPLSTYAANNLGEIYLFSDDVAQNPRKAFELFKKAVELDKDNHLALTNLASCYRNGTGINENPRKAVELFERAADAGNALATTLLGDMYHYGEGVNESPRKAFQFYKKAVELDENFFYAVKTLASCYRDGYGVGKDPYEAIELYERAANAGDSEAANFLGVMYANGEGVRENSRQAVQFYKRAIELDENNHFALNNLAYCYRNGSGVGKDPYEAFALYERAANAGNVDAMTTSGFMLSVGEGVLEDENQAFYWTKKAAEAGDVLGMENLAYSYREGIGTAQNISEAIEWYQRAADKGSEEAQKNLDELLNQTQPPASSYSSQTTTFNIVKKIVTKELGVEENEIQMSSTFVDDLGADSLDAVELVMAFEEEFNFEIPDNVTSRLRTVGDVVRYIESIKR